MATAKHKEKKEQLESSPFYKKHWIPLLIFSFSFFLYANTIGNDYNLDDELEESGKVYRLKENWE